MLDGYTFFVFLSGENLAFYIVQNSLQMQYRAST